MHYRILAIITKVPVLILHNDLGELAISYLFKHLEHAYRGSLHESGLSFNHERHLKFNPCLNGRLSGGLSGPGE